MKKKKTKKNKHAADDPQLSMSLMLLTQSDVICVYYCTNPQQNRFCLSLDVCLFCFPFSSSLVYGLRIARQDLMIVKEALR